ncbi:caspase domain-containing protein [Schizophyllum commune]
MTVLEKIKRAVADGTRSHVRYTGTPPTCPSLDTTSGAQRSSGSRLSSVVNLWRTVRRFVREFRQPIRRRALLIGIAYKGREDWALRGTHGDVDRVWTLLVERFQFRPEDITVMKDSEGVEDHLWPTEQNIRRELANFTANCGPRDRFFFLYAGHTEQKDERIKGSEEDGKDEYIIPYDAPDMDGSVCIEDNDLFRYLVKPLKTHCKLVALLDACHSATLLDLTHDKCLDISGWWGKVLNLLHRALDFLGLALPEPVEPPREDGPRTDGTMEDVCRDVALPMMERLVKPWRFCRGLCRRTISPNAPFVLCISSCKDLESAIETEKTSMTKTLVEVLETYESPSLAELLTRVRINLASAYNDECKALWKKKMTKAKKAGIGKILRLVPLGWFRLAPDKHRLPQRFHRYIPRYPPLAKVQMASNLPRQTAVEKFWL